MQDGSMNLLVTTGVKNHRPGEGNPLPSELAYGANRVELYRYVNYFLLFFEHVLFCARKLLSIIVSFVHEMYQYHMYSEVTAFIFPGENCSAVKG